MYKFVVTPKVRRIGLLNIETAMDDLMNASRHCESKRRPTPRSLCERVNSQTKSTSQIPLQHLSDDLGSLAVGA